MVLLQPCITVDCPDEIAEASINLATGFFVQHLHLLLKSAAFDQLWLRAFRLFLVFITNSRGQNQELATESLRNIVAVMMDLGVLKF